MILPSYSVFSFSSKEEHLAALYDACRLIVNTYDQTGILDDFDKYGLTSYEFAKFAKHILNEIAES